MPYFNYVAIDSSGKELKGKIDAVNEEAVAIELRKQGLFPTSVTAQHQGPSVAAPKKKKNTDYHRLRKPKAKPEG